MYAHFPDILLSANPEYISIREHVLYNVPYARRLDVRQNAVFLENFETTKNILLTLAKMAQIRFRVAVWRAGRWRRRRWRRLRRTEIKLN